MTTFDLITKQDLIQFKNELLAELKQLISVNGAASTEKKWLKSSEVRKLLKISPGTLQTLRINGKLPFSKIGTIHYYRYDDILKLLANNYKEAVR